MSIVRSRAALVLAAGIVVLVVGVAVLLTGLGNHTPAHADTPSGTTDTVGVSGSGTVEGVPDTLDASFDISAKRPSVQQALDASNSAARSAIDVLRKDGVASRDIQSQNVFVNPDYGDHGIDGYDAGQTLAVTIDQLSGVGKILTDVTTSAGNKVQLGGVSFDIRNNAGLVANAQAQAFTNAKTAAQKDASLAGRNLGRVISIKQTIQSSNDNETEPKAVAGTAGSPVPIETGQQPVTVKVSVIWALQ